MSDEEWVSDTESVSGDVFNKANFQSVRALQPGEVEAPVKGTTKPGIIPSFGVSMPSVQTSAPTPTNTKPPPAPPAQNVIPVQQTFTAPTPVHRQPSNVSAQHLEKEHAQEQLELQQARQFSKGDGEGRFQGISDQEVIDFFNQMNKKSFTEQAIEYLNAYWEEVGDQAEFIFAVAHRIFTEADMHRQGITLIFRYEEGCDVDYPTYLYFYEKLCKFVRENPQWREGQFAKSAVYEVKTAIKHKKELQEKVDVNFDGRISFLEFLLYQYNVFSNPAQFMQRARQAGDEHPAIVAARLALEEVNARIKAYEEERNRLEEGAKLDGVQGLTFKHSLAVLDSSPLAEELNKALITAEAAVRLAVRKFQGQISTARGADGFTPRGALWWMQRDLEEKKKYGRKG